MGSPLGNRNLSLPLLRAKNAVLCRALKEVAKRKHDMEGLLKAEEDEKPKKKKQKKRKKDGKQKVPNENHMKLRAVADAGRKWELELESVHSLSDLEACVCVGIVAKYHKSDSFPDSDPQESQKYLDFAREGWRHMTVSTKRVSMGYGVCIVRHRKPSYAGRLQSS
jgi:hypothetical protein